MEGVFVMNSDGTGLREIHDCTHLPCEILEMAWWPDDVHLAWTVNTYSDNANWVVQVVDVTDGATVDICNERLCEQGLGQLAWSPDGSELAFGKSLMFIGIGNFPSSIWVARADGSGTERLTQGIECIRRHATCTHDSNPTWSPDGTTLAFLRGPTLASGPPRERLVLLDPDGGHIRELDICKGVPNCSPGAPRWSPDGSSIIVATGWQPGTIQILDVATGRVSNIQAASTRACPSVDSPFWSPDGTRIAFDARPDHRDNLCAISRRGGAPEVLAHGIQGGSPLLDPNYAWLPAGAVEFPTATP